MPPWPERGPRAGTSCACACLRPARVVGHHPERHDVVRGGKRLRVGVGQRVSLSDFRCDVVQSRCAHVLNVPVAAGRHLTGSPAIVICSVICCARCKRAPAIVARHAGRAARAERVHEVGQLALQRLLVGNGLLAAFDARSSGPRPDQPPHLELLRRVVDRDVRVGLEQPDLPDTIAADAARRQIRDAAGRKPQPDVRDVDARRQHRHTDSVDRHHRRIDDRQDHVEIVDHQVEHDVDVEAALRERAEPVHLDEARHAEVRPRRDERRIETLGVADGHHHPTRRARRPAARRPPPRIAPAASRRAPERPPRRAAAPQPGATSVGTAIVTASTAPGSCARSVSTSVPHARGNLLRALAGSRSRIPISWTPGMPARIRA